MKWKKFCKSDLMIASPLIKNILLISLSILMQVAASNQHKKTPNSFYISQRIVHHKQQQQQPAELSSSSSSSSVHPYDTGAQLSDKYDSRLNLGSQLSAESAYERHQAAVDSDSSGGKMDEAGEGSLDEHDDESAENSQEVPERNLLMEQHNSQLQAMQDLFERRQLNNRQLQSSQELNPMSLGLDHVGPNAGGSPFSMPPFAVPNDAGPLAKPMANADNLDQGLGPALPFGLSPLPQLFGIQSPAFDGPQRGDQSAHSNHHASMPADSDGLGVGGGGGSGGGQKIWPKIFRFTDGRINLSEFEKSKKIKLSNKNQHNTDNHLSNEIAPVMFDGRPLKRKSFLILHGGIFGS